MKLDDPVLWVRVGGVLAVLFGALDLFFFHVLSPGSDKGADLSFIISGLTALGVSVPIGKNALAARHDQLHREDMKYQGKSAR